MIGSKKLLPFCIIFIFLFVVLYLIAPLNTTKQYTDIVGTTSMKSVDYDWEMEHSRKSNS